MKTKFLLLSLFVAFATYAQNVYAPGKIANNGYDVVSYFDKGPKKGSATYSTNHNGVKYLFANSSNLVKFKAKPNAYLPQYGGFCAYALAVSGKLVEVNPETYKIIDNKLYLFYNAGGTNTKTKWDKNQAKYLVKANKKWKEIIGK